MKVSQRPEDEVNRQCDGLVLFFLLRRTALAYTFRKGGRPPLQWASGGALPPPRRSISARRLRRRWWGSVGQDVPTHGPAESNYLAHESLGSREPLRAAHPVRCVKRTSPPTENRPTEDPTATISSSPSGYLAPRSLGRCQRSAPFACRRCLDLELFSPGAGDD